jgi:hypothetical protein
VGPILDFFNLADRGIPEESLPKEYKEAKDLYVKIVGYHKSVVLMR